MDATTTSLRESLLRIREYSDLIIGCGDQQFTVHRAYICAQSPVIAAKLRGNFVVSCILQVVQTDSID